MYKKEKVFKNKKGWDKRKVIVILIILLAIITFLSICYIKKTIEYKRYAENSYNQAFYKLVEYTNDTEKLLAKATISSSKKHAAKILSTAWKSATLAQTCLSFLPIPVNELEEPQKFLNQVSDYSFYLSKKTINGENLSEDDLKKLEELHDYSVNLVNTINQLENEIFYNTINWNELEKKGNSPLKNEDENLSKVSFSNIEEDLHQYTGLIYDGAFSENRNIFNGKGLTGEDISKEDAKNKAIEFIGNDRLDYINDGEEISIFNGNSDLEKEEQNNDESENESINENINESKNGNNNSSVNKNENASENENKEKEENKKIQQDKNQVKITEAESENLNNIDCYKFEITLKNNSKGEVLVSKKGGHIISFNTERTVNECNIKNDEACKIGKDFLNSKEFKSMKETYFTNQGNILTVNYAYFTNDVICYPDLVKVKIALDNGEILGVEAKNFFNNHDKNRNFDKFKISKEDCLKNINKKLEIKNIDKAVIPTEWNTEIFCYEVKGNAYGNDFIVFINSETGKEEDILMVLNTEEGTTTM